MKQSKIISNAPQELRSNKKYSRMKKKQISEAGYLPVMLVFLFCITLLSTGCQSENKEDITASLPAPAWWYNPRQDDEEFMFVKANSVHCNSEQSARDKAYANALAVLSKRIISNVNATDSNVTIQSRHAIRNTRIFAEKTIYCKGEWFSWALVSYPQKEKQKLLDKLDKIRDNIQDIRKRVKNIPNDFKVSIDTASGKKSFIKGEKIVFSLTSERDCHIALFCHQTDGSTILLFPNTWSGNTKVFANKRVTVPGTSKPGFEIVVGPPYGTDLIQVIACTQYSLLHKRLENMVEKEKPLGYRGISRGLFSRGINDSIESFNAKKLTPSWSETAISISTYKKL